MDRRNPTFEDVRIIRKAVVDTVKQSIKADGYWDHLKSDIRLRGNPAPPTLLVLRNIVHGAISSLPSNEVATLRNLDDTKDFEEEVVKEIIRCVRIGEKRSR